jgi:hypothetical protein
MCQLPLQLILRFFGPFCWKLDFDFGYQFKLVYDS